MAYGLVLHQKDQNNVIEIFHNSETSNLYLITLQIIIAIVFKSFTIEMITFLSNKKTQPTARSDLIPPGFYL